MEIVLKTHRDDQYLSITDMTKDSFNLFVRSGAFSGSGMVYHYDTRVIPKFIDDLDALESSNHGGTVKLVDVEDNELAFTKDKLGQLKVTGRLVPHTIPHQELQFGFITDQTCLAPLIADLRKARSDTRS